MGRDCTETCNLPLDITSMQAEFKSTVGRARGRVPYVTLLLLLTIISSLSLPHFIFFPT